MNNLISLLSDIDENYIDEADNELNFNSSRHKKITAITVIGAAACVCLALFGTAIANINGSVTPNQNILMNSTHQSTVHSQPDKTKPEKTTSQKQEATATQKPTENKPKETKNIQSTIPTVPDDNNKCYSIYNDSDAGKNNGLPEPCDSRLPHWDELGVAQQYRSLDYKGTKYNGYACRKILYEKTENEMGEYILSGEDYYTNVKKYARGSVYKIKGISQICAVAVRFGNSYYAYVNEDYTPSSLGKFIDDMSLANNIEIATSASSCQYFDNCIHDIEYLNIDSDEVINFLHSNRNAQNYEMSSDDNSSALISIGVKCSVGYENTLIEFTDSGYIRTTILSKEKNFYVGPEKCRQIAERLISSCKESRTKCSKDFVHDAVENNDTSALSENQ